MNQAALSNHRSLEIARARVLQCDTANEKVFAIRALATISVFLVIAWVLTG